MPEKYIYNGQVMQRADVEEAATKSNLDVNSYVQKAGIKVVNDNYDFNGKTVSAEDILSAANQSKLGFDDYIQKAAITAIPDVKKKETTSIGLSGAVATQNVLAAGAGSVGGDSSNGIINTPSSQSQSNSAAIGATVTNPVIEKQKSPLEEIVSLAQTQQQTSDLSTFPNAISGFTQPTVEGDILTPDTQQDKVTAVKSGNPDAIAEVVNNQQAAFIRQKDALNQKYSGAQSKDIPSYFKQYKAEQDTIDNLQKQLIQTGVSALDKVYADKLVASPDQSPAAQSAMGAELRKQKAKIGADPTYTDQELVANTPKKQPLNLGVLLPQMETSGETQKDKIAQLAKKAIVKSDYSASPTEEKMKQEYDFTNRATILGATLTQQNDKSKQLQANPVVQQYINGTDEERQNLETNSDVQAAIQANNDANATKEQYVGLIDQYPQVKAEAKSQQVAYTFADYIRRARSGEFGSAEQALSQRSLFEGTKLNDDYEIKRVVELSKGTLTEDEVRQYANDANVPSYLGLTLRGFGDVIKETEQGLNRLTLSKRDADIQNRIIEETKYHPPEALQLTTKNINPDTILSTMFSTVGRIAAYGLEGEVGGELIGGVTGLTRAGRLAKEDLATLNTAEQILPSSKLADLMVNMGVADNSTDALGQIISATSKAKNISGTFTSMYATSYENAYQEAAKLTTDEDKRKEYAGSMATANGLAMVVLNPANIASKAFSGLSREEAVMNFLKTDVGINSESVIKDRLTEIAKTTGLGVAQSLIPVINESLAKSNIFDYHTSSADFWNQALNSAMNMAVGILPLGILGSSKTPSSEFLKSSLFQAGDNPELVKASIEDAFINGSLNDTEKNRQISVVNTISDLVNKVPEKNSEGVDLTQTQKNELVYRQLQNLSLSKKAEGGLKEHYQKEIAQNDSVINDIMSAKETMPATANTNSNTEPSAALSPEETAAIDIIKGKDFTILKPYTDVLKDENSSVEDKQNALKGISDQMLSPATAEVVGSELGKQGSEAIDALSHEAPAESQALKDINAPNPQPDITVGEMLSDGTPGIYKGQRGLFSQDGQAVIFKPENSNKEYELGNIDEIKNNPIKDFGISHEQSVVNVDSEGNFNVRGEKYMNPFEERGQNPLDAILYDKNGDIVNVRMKTPEGERRTFKGNIAEDLAYQINLKEINKNNETRAAFEQHINEDAAAKKEIKNGGLSQNTPASTTENNAAVSREKIEPQTVEVKAVPIKVEKQNETTKIPNQTETTPADTGTTNETIPTAGEGTGQPPPEQAAGVTDNTQPDNVTHINKADITSAQDLAKSHPLQGGKVSWENSVNSAIHTLAKEAKPQEKLSDVAKRKIGEWGIRIDKELADKGKTTFNPTDEDLATMSYYRTHLNEQLKGLNDRINSGDDAVRLQALDEAKDIQSQIAGVDYVLSESGKVAGRSFYIRQMVAKMDADNNLQVRRMDIMNRQNGEPLTPDQETAITKLTAQEAKNQKDTEKNIPKYSQEDFDAKVKQEVDRISKERQKNKGSENKTEKTLKQTGNEWADKILKAQIKLGEGGLQSNILGLPIATWNLLVKGVSEAVRTGANIADAIKEAASKYKISESDLTKHLIGGFEKQDILDNIKELADKEGSKDLTKSAVGKGLINDLVNNHIEAGLRGKEVFDQVNKDLKDAFPSISEQDVRDAYLKQGQYKFDKETDINKDKKEAQSQLKNIATLETKLEDARKNKAGSKTESGKRKWSDEETKIKKELDKELNTRNIKAERNPKEEVDIKRKVAASHNDRMDELAKSVDEKLKDSGLSDEDKAALKHLKNTAELAKVDTKTAEKIDNALDRSANELRKAAVDIAGHKDILDKVSKAITDLKKDSSDATQDILLTRHKRNLENKIKEANRKIEAKEFDNSLPAVRTKSDVESIRLEIERRKIDAQYRRLQDLAEQKAKTKWEKGLGLAQTAYVQSLIGGVKTGGVVLSSALTKQPLNTISNLIFGSIAHVINPTLSRAAGAEAPFSLRQEANRYMAHYAAIGEKGMQKIFDRSEAKLNEATASYEALKKQYGDPAKGTPEYNKLQQAKNRQLQALISHQSNFLFKWIGSNAWKDSGNVLLKGASQLDTLLGHQQQVGWKDMTRVEKTEMVISMMGALHGYFKNFSARAEFAAAFTARLENKARNDIDISDPGQLLRTANESFVNFLMGKYQEDNFATKAMNGFSRLLEEIGNEPSEQGVSREPKNKVTGKVASALFRGKYPILRTGVNIGREAIVEYLLGTPIGAALHGAENVKAIAKAIREGSPIRETIREHIKDLSPDKVDLIFRCYRKGGVALVGTALAAMGLIKFGGFYNQDDWQRRKGELHQGDVEIFGHVFDHKSLVAKAFTHNPVNMGALMVANTRQVYERKYSRGKEKGDFGAAISDGLVSDLEGAADIIPVLNNNFGNPIKNLSLPYGKTAADIMEQLDTDKNGNTVQRNNSGFWNRFKYNIGLRETLPVK